MGHVTLDGAVGSITDVAVTDGEGAITYCQSNGDYTLDSAHAGYRFITASLAGFFYDSTRFVTVLVEDTVRNVDFTLRRLEPTVPTGLAAAVDTANGTVTLTWNPHPDPTVDIYLLQRLQYGGEWTALAVVPVPSTTYTDHLPEVGQWFYRIATSDLNVIPPPSLSAWSVRVWRIWGELVPCALTFDGGYDDRIKLSWRAPNLPAELSYDDGTAEAWYAIQNPNGQHDYFAVRFTLPEEPVLTPPIEFRYAAVLSHGTQGYSQVMVCDGYGTPNVNNPLISVPNVAAPQAMDWAIAEFDDFYLETTGDFWVVVQFIPGIIGDAIGADGADPDGRSRWYSDEITGTWHTWNTHDWMIHCFLGVEEDGGLLSLGPSPSSGPDLPFEATLVSMPPVTEQKARGPQSSLRGTSGAFSFTAPQLIWNAKAQSAQPSDTRNNIAVPFETDQMPLYYKIYRDGAYLDTSYATEYFDIGLTENVLHDYYVTGCYDNSQESGASNTVSAMCNIGPAAPGNFVGVGNATEDSMFLTWDDPTLNVDSSTCVDLTLLTITRDGQFLADIAPGVEWYVDVPPNLTMPYTWSIVASDEVPNIGPPADFIGQVQPPWHLVPYTWNDISTVGTVTPLLDNQNVGPFDLGFDVTYYGNTFNSIRICSNGFVSFTSTSNSGSNVQIPDGAEPNNLIAFFWDDLNPGAGGTVYRYADPVNHWFTVQFDSIPRHSGGFPYTMQVIITDQGAIYMNYNTINGTTYSCTIGVENVTGTSGVPICFDGQGNFQPQAQTSIRINPPILGFGAVAGHVTLDGAIGDISEVSITDGSGAVAYCESNGDYLLDSTRAGDRYITAGLQGLFYDSTRIETVPLEDTLHNIDFTLRRLEPAIPTGFAAVVDTANGTVTLTWNVHPDPTVDVFVLQRMGYGGQWEALVTVPASQYAYTDDLPEENQWYYRIAASDLNVIPPPSQSAWSDPVDVIWGELPPMNLVANGNYDDRIRLRWTVPAGSGPGVGTILVVDDDGGPNNGGIYTDVQQVFFDALDDAGYEYDVFIVDWTITSTPQSGPTTEEMDDYDVVVWFTGETWGYYGDDTITLTDEANLADYLDAGGNLFLSAQDYFYESYRNAGAFVAGQFPYDYLGVTSTIQDFYAPPISAIGSIGSFAVGMTFTCTVPYPLATLRCDEIQTAGTALLLADYSGAAACQYEGAGFRTAFTSLSLEGLDDGAPPSTKAQFMENLIEFLTAMRTDQTVSAPPRLSISPIAEFNPTARVLPSNGATKQAETKISQAPAATEWAPVLVRSAVPAGILGQIVPTAGTQLSLIKNAWNNQTATINTRNGLTNLFETDQVLMYYKIYRDGAYIDTSYANAYYDIGVAENVWHEYYVTGYYDNGAESEASNTDSAICNMAPAAAGNFAGVANVTEDSMTLTWDDPTLNANGSPCVDLAQLTISRDGVFVANVAPGVERCADAPPNLTMTYSWTVTAEDEVPNVSSASTFVGEVQSPWNMFPYFWNDISGVGTPTPLSDDESAGPFDLGFDVSYYGNTYNSIRICSNGFVSFTDSSHSSSNVQIPSVAEPNNLIAFFWDDLDPSAGGTVYRYADPVNHWFTVQFDSIPHYILGGPYTMQVIITDQSAIYMNYNTINPPTYSCTVGLENASGTIGIHVCNNNVGDFIPHSNSSIAFWAGPPPQGDLEGYVYENATPNLPIRNAMVTCGADSAYTDGVGFYQIFNILEGTYDITASNLGYIAETETVVIAADSLAEQDFYLTQPLIDVDVSSIEATIEVGGSHQETFNISNLGDGTLDYEIHIPGAGFPYNPPVELAYDDSTAENWYVVQLPNGPHDYFGVHFALPSEPVLNPPIEFRYVAILAHDTLAWAQVMVCEDLGGIPDVNNPLISVANASAPQAMDWAIVEFEDFGLETTEDFWVVVQFTPGINGTGIGSDNSAPDLRSYWYYDTTPGEWHQWTQHDWIIHSFLGAEEDGGLFSLGPQSSRGAALPIAATALEMPLLSRRGTPTGSKAESRVEVVSEIAPALAGPINRAIAGIDDVDERWVWATPDEGSVEPQESQLIRLDFLMPDTAQVGDFYAADLIIENNTITPTITIPITVNIVASTGDPEEILSLDYALYQNYPNPFNPTTRIRFDLRERSHVVLEVFNILGQRVATVLDRTIDAGQYSASFDASRMASGVYFYRIVANDFEDLRKMVMVR